MGCHDPMSFSEAGALERRAYPRFQVALGGICSIAGGDDVACKVLDLSLGGARLTCASETSIGDAVSLLLPHIGLIAARVARFTDDGFGVVFSGSIVQRRRVQDFLVFALQMLDDQAIEDRAFERIVPLRRTVEIRRAGGRAHMARVRDVSRSGVALTTTVAMCIGEVIQVGVTAAEIIRVFDGGAAARFSTPLAPTFDATIIL